MEKSVMTADAAGLQAHIQEIVPELVETRHYLHQHPELSGQEAQTAAFVADQLRRLGLTVRERVGGYGIVAELHGAEPGRTFALRADMDALPIREANTFAYCSQNPGVMHACGHDGHTTTLLGTAQTLTRFRDRIRGSVRFIFQPAEETVGGAKQMCEDGAMEGVGAIAALHGWAHLGVGQIGIRSGAMMASADHFDLTIHGKGAHAAYPHTAIDPIVVGAQVVLALQTLVSREVDPNEPAVVTIGQFSAGTAHNIIPNAAALKGTVRTLSKPLRDTMEERIRRVAEGVCRASRASCELTYVSGTPPVLNDPEVTQLIASVGESLLGVENVVALSAPSMGAEDFAVYLDYAPGAMFRLGLGEVAPLHTPNFDFSDAALPVGIALFSRLALTYLSA